MDREKLYRQLEDEFASTFLGELIPGMLHNFANPLNGIMGRSRLLQQRLEDCIENMKTEHPETYDAMEGALKKLASDADLIIGETERFYEMFRNVSRKFFSISSKTEQMVDFSRLVEEEIQFADCYLDFKHHVIRKVLLKPGIPAVSGVPAHYSLGFSSLLRYAMIRMGKSAERELQIAADWDGRFVRLSLLFTDEGLPGRPEALSEGRGDDLLVLCLRLFEEYGAHCRAGSEGGRASVEVLFPPAGEGPLTGKR
jgi:signal transduction histidine kinase